MTKNREQPQPNAPSIPSDPKLSSGEINALLSALNNLSVKLGEATGAIVFVEIQMRLICQLSEPARIKLVEHTAKSRDNRKSYWECDPAPLAQAIADIFKAVLNDEEQKQILIIPSLRAKLLHGELIGLLERLGVNPLSRQMTLLAGSLQAQKVEAKDIVEAIKCIDRNDGLGKVRRHALTTSGILERIIKNHLCSN